MTPNDKLPEETYNKVLGDAVAYDKERKMQVAYYDGATAWAGWKVRFDELQVQAQRMADALELTKASISSLIKPAYWNQEISDEQRELIKTRNTIETTLQQFKDGKEEERETVLSSEEKKKLLANKIDARIKELGLQRQQFAGMMKVQPSSVTKWLSGEHNFEIFTLFEIERQLNINLFNL